MTTAALGTLVVELSANLARFEQEMKRGADIATGAMQKIDGAAVILKRGLGAIGLGFSAGAIVQFAARSLDAVAALDDLAEKTSLSVEFLDQLQQVATRGGQSMETVAAAAGKFSENVAKARGGDAGLLKLFEGLGVSAAELKNQNIDQLFLRVANTINNASDRANANAYATGLMGKSARELAPLLNDIREKGLGFARVTTQMAAEADRAQKNINEFKLRVEGVSLALGSEIAVRINALAKAFEEADSKGLSLAETIGKIFRAAVSGGDVAEAEARFRKTVDQIVRVREEIKKLDEAPDAPRTSGAEQLLEVRRQRLQAQLRALEAERDKAVKDINRNTPVAPPAPPKVDIAPPPDPAVAAAEAAAERARLGLAEARAKAVADSEKRLAEVRLDLLERFYNEGLIGEEDYWSRRLQVQQAASAAAITEVNKEIRARQAAFSAAPKGTAEYFNALKELEDAQNRRKALEEAVGVAAVKSNLDARKAAKGYEDAITDIRAKLDELQGRTASAVASRFDQQTEQLRNRANAANDEGTVRLLNQLRAATVAQGEFNDARAKGDDVAQSLALAEERIQNSLRTGAISELEAMRRTSVARQAALGPLKEQARILDEAAAASGIEKLRLDADRFRVSLEQLESQADLVRLKLDSIVETSFGDALSDFITGTKTAKEAFADFADSVLQQISRLAAQDIATKLFRGAGGKEGGKDGAQTAGGLLEKGLEFLKGLIPSFDVGTPYVPRTGLALVHQGERIIPAAQNTAGGMGGNINITINSQGPAERSTTLQMANEVGRAVSRAMRRNG